MSDVLGVAFYVAIALIGITSTILASIWTWRFLRRHNMEVIPAALIVSLAALLAFWGLWIVFDVCWIIAAVVKLAIRIAGGNRRPAPQRS